MAPRATAPGDPDPNEASGKQRPSWGNVGQHHWSRARQGMNEEALEYYRQRSRAPGMEQAGPRNAYCMSCDGVIPLEVDSGRPAPREPRHCPHCGVELDARVQRMFNWVEIDQVPEGDARFVLPVLLAFLALGAGLLLWLLL